MGLEGFDSDMRRNISCVHSVVKGKREATVMLVIERVPGGWWLKSTH
jgi:hypothetical protein